MADEQLPNATEWKAIVARFQEPSNWRASWQLLNTFVPYALLWYAMHRCIEISYWLVLPLAVLASGFLVRIFIIFHDCGHGSFFRNRWANTVTGFISGLLTFTPYYHWRWAHATHHGGSGDLDRRGTGDIWTMTVEEYLKSSRWSRFAYRLARNPIVLFVIAPIYVFLISERFPSADAKVRERHSVYLMNVAIAAMVVAMGLVVGFKQYVFIQLILTAVSGGAGVWLFYVQHQFEEAYWERGDDWDYTSAAMQGSSFYKLPKILQWFSGNIGFHHIHHLSPRIPNYNLQRCHDADPLFQQVRPMTMWTSLRSLPRKLWDERRKRLISFRQLKLSRQQGTQQDSRLR